MTSPTLSAEERADLIACCRQTRPGGFNWQAQRDCALEQIRQAEQAARADERRKTLGLIDLWKARMLKQLTQGEPRLLRYFDEACGQLQDRLKDNTAKPSEPGEAA